MREIKTLKNYVENEDGEYHSSNSIGSDFSHNCILFFWMDR